MPSTPDVSLKWSSQFIVAPSSQIPALPGDKILLPPSALEQLLAAAPTVTSNPHHLPHTTTFDPFNPYTFAAERHARTQFQDRQQQLPHPLTFRLVNPSNGRAVYAGIREFSAHDGQVVLSPFLRNALAFDQQNIVPQNAGYDVGEIGESVEPIATSLTVHAIQLPKGTFVKLRPLEAGYDPEDWKSLLEQHLRANFTTLTQGEILIVPAGRLHNGKKEEFRFVVDGFKPEGDGICVVDTDLEVDIEALNEEQARETLKQIAAKHQRAPDNDKGSSRGGSLPYLQRLQGQVLPGDYVDYELSSWDRSQCLEIELDEVEGDGELDLFVSPFSTTQRARPREDEFLFCEIENRYPKRIQLSWTNIELERAEAIWITVRSYASPDKSKTLEPAWPTRFHIRVAPCDPKVTDPKTREEPPAANDLDEVQCNNCKQSVPRRTLVLHENFCLRNNIACPKGCGAVFQKRSSDYQNHWHCPHDNSFGNTPLSHAKHDSLCHIEVTCPSCPLSFKSLQELARHRTSICPGKLILCQFCHLQVPQEGDPTGPPDPEVILSGLTPHEIADGARTTECHLCEKIVRLRDMATHLKHHEFERLSRPSPRPCRNVNCGRTLDGIGKSGDTRAGTRSGQGPGNDIGLCSVCFGPLYVSLYDPDGRALKRRVERRYLSQLLTGCGKPWCRNEFCRAGKKNNGGEDKAVSTKEVIPDVKPYLEGMAGGEWSTPLHFCVDNASQNRRVLAECLTEEGGIEGKGGYALEWCIAALEAENGKLDVARDWLKNWAPQREETGGQLQLF